MADVMMALGRYRFSIDTAAFEEFTRSQSWRWAAQERLGRVPAQQFIGPGEDRVTLKGVIFPIWRGGLNQTARLSDEAGRGEPLEMVDAFGRGYGRWCITSLSQTRSTFLPGGVPKRIEYTIALIAYGEDAA